MTRLANNVSARLAIDPKSYARWKDVIKQLERVTRREVVDKALTAGGSIIHDAAEQRAPGKLEQVIVGGRTLRSRVDAKFAFVLKANARVAAIGPDAKHWYYRFFEFGATPHDIHPHGGKVLALMGDEGLHFAAHAERTGGVKKKPFLRPAVDEEGGAAINAMAFVLDEELRKVHA